MATAKKKGLPDDWQAQAMSALTEMKKKDTTRTVFGLSFPKSWRGELMQYARTGELRKLLGVSAISFDGDSITRLEKPETQEAKAS